MSTYIQSKLDKVNSFIGDITNVHYFRVKFADVLEKYTTKEEDAEFAQDLKAIIASRNGYQKILTKYDAIKVKLQRPGSVSREVVESIVEVEPVVEEVVAHAVEAPLTVTVTVAKKSKKSKKSKK